jgi:hypothetical protein
VAGHFGLIFWVDLLNMFFKPTFLLVIVISNFVSLNQKQNWPISGAAGEEGIWGQFFKRVFPKLVFYWFVFFQC